MFLKLFVLLLITAMGGACIFVGCLAVHMAKQYGHRLVMMLACAGMLFMNGFGSLILSIFFAKHPALDIEVNTLFGIVWVVSILLAIGVGLVTKKKPAIII